MKNALKISIYLLGIFLVLSSAGLAQLGTVVTLTDPDLHLALTPLPPVGPGVNPYVFFDVQPNGIYDAADPVYFTSSGIQTRMTYLVPPHTPGSKVAFPDSDFFALWNFAIQPNFDPQIVYVPKFGTSSGYVQGDPIYLAMHSGPIGTIQTNDIRLTKEGTFLVPGTKVTDSQPDWGNQWLQAPGTWSLQYADVNGNSIYDAADRVFLHISGSPVVGLGDIHLD